MIARANRTAKKPIKATAKKRTAKSSGNTSKTKAARTAKAKRVPEKVVGKPTDEKTSTEIGEAPILTVTTGSPTDPQLDGITRVASINIPAEKMGARVKVERDAPGGPYVDWGGKHHGKAYSDIDAGYLNWMIKNAHRSATYAAAELRARALRLANPEIILTPEAIDEASMSCRVVFAETRGNFEGLHSWLIRMCKLAIEKFEHSDKSTEKSITVYSLGLKFRFKHTGPWTLLWIGPVNHPGVWWGAEQQSGLSSAAHAEGRRQKGKGVW